MGKVKTFYNSKWFNPLLFIVLFIVPYILYWQQFSNNLAYLSGDGVQYFSIRNFVGESLKAGELPLWNKYLEGGMPFSPDFSNTAFYPPLILFSLLPIRHFIYGYYAYHLAIGGFFLYLYLKKIGCTKQAATITAFLYEMSIHLGGARKSHIALIVCIVYLPAVLYFIELYFEKRQLSWLLFSAAALSMQFLTGAAQHAAYACLAAFVYLLAFGIHYRIKIKMMLLHGAAWFIAFVGFTAVQLLPALQMLGFYKDGGAVSGESYEFFRSFSIHFSKLLYMIFPEAYVPGQQVGGFEYSSEMDIELFVGIFVLAIALFAVFRYFKEYRIKVFTGIMLGAFLFASSANFPLMSEILFLIPVYNGFRVISRILFIFIFFVYVLFAIGLSKLEQEQEMGAFFSFAKKNAARLFAVLAIVVVTLTFVEASIRQLDAGVAGRQFSDMKNIMLPAVYIVLLLLAVVCVLVRLNKVKYKKRYTAFMAVTVVVTLATVLPYTLVTHSTKLSEFRQPSADSQLFMEDKGDYKIFEALTTLNPAQDTVFPYNSNMSQKISVVNAYVVFNNPRLYRMLANNQPVGLNGSAMMVSSPMNRENLYYQNDLLSMLGVKYIADHGEYLGQESPVLQFGQSRTILGIGNIEIPKNPGKMSVHQQPISIKPKQYYYVEFQAEADNDKTNLFVDFWNEGYDNPEQEVWFRILKGKRTYSGFIYTEKSVPDDTVFIRMACDPEANITVTNFLCKEVDATDLGSVYTEVFSRDDGNLTIYENKNAKEVLFAPKQVMRIESEEEVYQNLYTLDLVSNSYVKDIESVSLENAGTVISDIDFSKNNSITAKVSSDQDTFVNFSQSYFPGWKAYVDGKETKVHMVNGLIQGIEVPSGEHTIKFSFTSPAMMLGAIVTLLTAVATILLCIKDLRKDSTFGTAKAKKKTSKKA